jgi:selenocysteine lyase/cysteine desulfurase
MFPTTKNFTYFDIARKAILPTVARDAMQGWYSDIETRAGESAFSVEKVEETRKTAARVFGAPASNLALVKNTSEGVNIVAQGFDGLGDGDNVIVSYNEHENNVLPWRHLKRRGVEVRIAQADENGRLTVDDYRKVADARTKIISVAWVSYGTGFRADLASIAQYCREIGAKMVVDGIQAVGVLSDRIDSFGADVLVAGGHKAQFSVTGAGIMYMTDEMISRTSPPYAAKFSFTSNDPSQTDPKLAGDIHRFDYGNPNFLGCCVQRASAAFIETIGLGHIEDRVRDLTTALIEGAQERQIRIRTPLDWEERAGIVSFHRNGDAPSVEAKLRESGFVACAKDGHIRASLHFYNTMDEVDAFLDNLSRL